MCLPILVERPDLAIDQSTYQGFEYAITHNDMGYRCGYVKLEPGHPWYQFDHMDIDANVHGGLTFSEPDLPCDQTGADDGWWLGFDCGHCFDAPDPEFLAPDQPVFKSRTRHATIRTTDYVRANIQKLIIQAINAIIQS